MKTLEHWQSRFGAAPITIECPEMRLIGRDDEPPIFVGPGQIDIKNSADFGFRLFALPPHGEGAIVRLLRAHSNPYEMLDQFRLFAIDYEETEWAGGYTRPRIEHMSHKGALLCGRVSSLLTCVTADWVAAQSGVELLFQPGFHLPMESPTLTVYSIGDEEIERSWQSGKHLLEILGSKIEFFKDPRGDALWVTANASEHLPHPCLENWLSEPLRILLGQLIYPRLVARNLGNGSAHVSIRPSPKHFRNASIGALIACEPDPTIERFWELYSALLDLIVRTRNEQGMPNFQPHRVTRFYEEIIQASQGSRWVLCMTLASTSEGLSKLLMKPEDQNSEFDEVEIKSMMQTVKAWKGDKDLKARILGEVDRLGKPSIRNFMRSLGEQGVLESRHEKAWSSVRNKVMHGKLVSQWSMEEEDEQIVSLGELVHALTRKLAGVSG